MAKLSLTHQILCISHLPAITAMADHHDRIQKQESDDKTVTTVTVLSRTEMIAEISRLIGGDHLGEHSLLHSEELKSWSDKFKSELRH